MCRSGLSLCPTNASLGRRIPTFEPFGEEYTHLPLEALLLLLTLPMNEVRLIISIESGPAFQPSSFKTSYKPLSSQVFLPVQVHRCSQASINLLSHKLKQDEILTSLSIWYFFSALKTIFVLFQVSPLALCLRFPAELLSGMQRCKFTSHLCNHPHHTCKALGVW